MRDMTTMGAPHPEDDLQFIIERRRPVWYLSHPLAPDDKYTFQQNMDHVLHMLHLCWNAGLNVIAPYHTICLIADDNNPNHRARGIGSDCYVARQLRRIILSGHRQSTGMSRELHEVKMAGGGQILDIVGMKDNEARIYIEAFRDC